MSGHVEFFKSLGETAFGRLERSTKELTEKEIDWRLMEEARDIGAVRQSDREGLHMPPMRRVRGEMPLSSSYHGASPREDGVLGKAPRGARACVPEIILSFARKSV
jgi:hypothetical protein